MVSPERLEKYRDFVEMHSKEGIYDPQKGLTGLLSILTPDPKGVVLIGMNGGEIYFTDRQIYRSTQDWLENQGLPTSVFPVTYRSVWNYYCQQQGTSEEMDGSLVKIGAVVKQVYEDTAYGFRTGYLRSLAGTELAQSLVTQAIEFVYQTEKRGIPHRYKSMWRILGAVSSTVEQRRPMSVFQIVDFLMHNRGPNSAIDIAEELMIRGDVNFTDSGVISKVLRSLGGAGIIDYGPIYKDIISYILANPDKNLARLAAIGDLLVEIKRENEDLSPPGPLVRIVRYISQYPNSFFEVNKVADLLGMGYGRASSLMSTLAMEGILTRADGRFAGDIRRKAAKVNDLTYLFYDLVLQPSRDMAYNLIPIPGVVLTKEKIALFLQNYQAERSQVGPSGGEYARANLLDILVRHSALKRSEVIRLYNQRSDRELNSATIGMHLGFLVDSGLVEKTQRGFYRLNK